MPLDLARAAINLRFIRNALNMPAVGLQPAFVFGKGAALVLVAQTQRCLNRDTTDLTKRPSRRTR